MDCRSFREIFSDFLDGALDAAVEARCRRHVASCEACRRFDSAYRTGVSTLRGLDPLSPARDLSVRILHRVRREPKLALLAGGYGLAGALLLTTLIGLVALDIQERDQAGPAPLVAAIPQEPVPQDDEALDLITVRVRDAAAYWSPATPYLAVPITGPDASSRLRFEVPAVWTGR